MRFSDDVKARLHELSVVKRIIVSVDDYCVSSASPLCFTCFRFWTTRIDGISMIYFRFSHLLGRPHYMGDVYLSLCIVKVMVCVIVLLCVLYVG